MNNLLLKLVTTTLTFWRTDANSCSGCYYDYSTKRREKLMEIDITKQEAWKLIDAIQAYMKDYTVTGPVHKTFDAITKKLKGVLQEK